jgi:ATP-dependent Lhr-like helicase
MRRPAVQPDECSIQSSEKKSYDIRVGFPELSEQETARILLGPTPGSQGSHPKEPLDFIFANSRRLCEKLTHLINIDEEKPLAYAHHGSLSRDKNRGRREAKCDLKRLWRQTP